jgi:uncharacterized protein (DUF849 family)
VPALLQACLNGSRGRDEHPAVPRTPAELAAEGRDAVAAGARVLHLHPYDEAAGETLAAEPCAAALRAVRAACPGTPISLSTSADIEAHPGRRLELIAAWTELPELVTANQGEAGIVDLCEQLFERGVGIEAGILELADARAFLASGIGGGCVRVLVEPLDADPEAAVEHAAAIEALLEEAGVELEQVHHGDDVATWHGMRRLPDGRRPEGNGELVRAAAAMLA